ncbi:MAG: response regulator [Bdellovibrionales bacterium]|nr:response regulator [Bdellovibrionales bacterium]
MKVDPNSTSDDIRNLIISPVSNYKELVQSFELIYKQYLKFGYSKENSYGLRFTLRDLLPETMTFVAREREKIVGTVSIIANSIAGLPSKQIFKNQVDQLEQGGKIIAEGTRFACVDDSKPGGMGGTALNLLKWYFQWGQVRQVDELILVINPKHKVFWNRILGFEILAEEKDYPHANGAPALLMRCNLARVNLDQKATRASKKLIFEGPYSEKDFLSHLRLNEQQVVDLLNKDLSVFEQADISTRWVFSQLYPFATQEIQKQLTKNLAISVSKGVVLPTEFELDCLAESPSVNCFPLRWSLTKCIEKIENEFQKNRIIFSCTVDDGLEDNLIGSVEVFEKAFYYTCMNLIPFINPYGTLKTTIKGIRKSGAKKVLEVSFFPDTRQLDDKLDITDFVFSPKFKLLRTLYSEMRGIVEVQNVHMHSRRLVFTCEFSIFEETFEQALNVDTQHPLSLNAQNLAQKNEYEILGGMKVLVVEDNQVSRFLLKKFLESYGMIVKGTHSGFSALQMLREEVFHVVIMDCQMPGLDGFETARRIRKLDSPVSGIPIVACTAFVLKGDRKRCFDAGMNEYVSKPIEPKVLVNAVRSALIEGINTYEFLKELPFSDAV